MRPPHGSPQCIIHALHHDVGRMAQRVFTWEDSPITSGSPLLRYLTSLHPLLEPTRQTCLGRIRTPAPYTASVNSSKKISRQLNNNYSEHEVSSLYTIFLFLLLRIKESVCRGSGLIQSERDSGIGGITIPHTRLRNGHTADIIGM
jgi:hypothetical protein